MKKISLLINILMLVALLPALWMTMFSPMIFDSGETTHTWWLFRAIVAFPILIVLSQIVAWIAFFKANYKLAIISGLFPLLDILLLAILFMA